VQNGDELGHRGHFHARGENASNDGADDKGRREPRVRVHLRGEQRHAQRDRHTDRAEEVTASRGLLFGESAECENEENAGKEVGGGLQRRGESHRPPRNIASMRWVTRNPPAMLIVATRTAIAPSTAATVLVLALPACKRPPTRMIPETAFVTLISGV
jgi:hypothetical protein